MFKFSKTSLKRMKLLEPELIILLFLTIKESPFDFTITETLRDTETQKKYYKDGKSTLDGINKKSRHQENERGLSEAFDIMCYDEENQGTWKLEYYKEVADVFKMKAKELGIKIVWGGDWKNFVDCPHFQLA